MAEKNPKTIEIDISLTGCDRLQSDCNLTLGWPTIFGVTNKISDGTGKRATEWSNGLIYEGLSTPGVEAISSVFRGSLTHDKGSFFSAIFLVI